MYEREQRGKGTEKDTWRERASELANEREKGGRRGRRGAGVGPGGEGQDVAIGKRRFPFNSRHAV